MEVAMPDQEQERLKRLRERQIADRDPLVKQRKLQQNYSVKSRRMQKSFKLSEAWADIPHIVRTPFYGLVIGVVVTFILTAAWDSPFAFWVGLLATALLIVFGLVLGNALDLRDNIKDNLK
jgi:hypothetical protein